MVWWVDMIILIKKSSWAINMTPSPFPLVLLLFTSNYGVKHFKSNTSVVALFKFVVFFSLVS